MMTREVCYFKWKVDSKKWGIFVGHYLRNDKFIYWVFLLETAPYVSCKIGEEEKKYLIIYMRRFVLDKTSFDICELNPLAIVRESKWMGSESK